ncbi:MAG TPA: glycosyltransferase family 39 protein [Luteimonas sp.]|nr:glycosyltransferase family 39 protein [Luteimonas sp.]
MRKTIDMRVLFIALWAGISLLKVMMAARLPLFVDEAFYWQESRHLSWAYSDLPGLTAWLIRIGDFVFGEGRLALRTPFLLIAAVLPWLVVRIAAREFDMRHAWLAGIAALLLPLAGSLGLLALPDVPMALATLLCMDAGARLLRNVSDGAALLLGAGLAIGALSHYRFIAVIGVGFVVLLSTPAGRRVLADPRVWIAIAFGAAAWTPLMAWNMDNAEAGLRFQLVDRHPWAFHADGLQFIAIQGLLVTPLLFVALLSAAWHGRAADAGRRYLAWLGGLVVLGFFVLGFFADTRRVSFHWPLPGYLALLPLLPALLDRWAPWLRRLTWALAACGLVAVLGYYAAVSAPSVREQTAALKWYPSNFAGWDALAAEVQARRARMPGQVQLVAGNFKIGAELGFALGEPDIPVLPHPLNREHGRAPQLRLWGLRSDTAFDRPTLLVVGASDVEYKNLLQRYHALCQQLGPLPAPHALNIDHGAQRYVLFEFDGKPAAADAPCTTPAMAWFDAPVSGAKVERHFDVSGWAFKDGVGLSGVEVLLDGKPMAKAEYGLPSPGTASYWKISTDPQHPKVGFRARVDAGGLARGRHWLGLRLHGRDGSVEDWSEQPVDIQ